MMRSTCESSVTGHLVKWLVVAPRLCKFRPFEFVDFICYNVIELEKTPIPFRKEMSKYPIHMVLLKICFFCLYVYLNVSSVINLH